MKVIGDTYIFNRMCKIICFGHGRVKMGLGKDDLDQQLFVMTEVKEAREVGAYEFVTPDNQFFDDNGEAETVVLGFNKPESIDVMIEFLQEAKQRLIKNPPGKV